MDGIRMKKKPKLLLIGFRAYGDWLFSLPALNVLLDKYEVYLETTHKGFELFHDDPRFKQITMLDFAKVPGNKLDEVVNKRIEGLKETIKPDRVIDLDGTLEVECIALRRQEIFSASTKQRQAHFGRKNFHEAVLERCEIPLADVTEDYQRILHGMNSLHFSYGQRRTVGAWKHRQHGKFLVAIAVAGTCSHKVFPYWPAVVKQLRERFEDIKIYLFGDESLAYLEDEVEEFKHDNVVCMFGTVPFKQAVLMMKRMDFVLGGETGLMVAAGMWGTPKIMLATASGLYQMTKYDRNDYSVQADIECSPCHKAIYNQEDCGNMVKHGEDTIPPCITKFNVQNILDRVERQYEHIRPGLLQAV